MRVVAGDDGAALALEVYCHRIRKYVGAYLAVLTGAPPVLGAVYGFELMTSTFGGLAWPPAVHALDAVAALAGGVLPAEWAQRRELWLDRRS